MARGGKRPGAGRPKGAKNKPKPLLDLLREDAAMRQRVALCAGSGMGVPEISIATGMTEDQLLTCFARELEHGRALVRADALVALKAAADDGNAAAAKALLVVTEKNDPEPDAPPGSSRSAKSGDAASRAVRYLQ